jgi:phosphoglycerate dehydrogenase-like enzyme
MKLCVSAEVYERYAAEIAATAPGWEVVRIDPDGTLHGDLSDVEVLFFSIELALQPAALAKVVPLMEAPSLRWLQSPGAGVDHPVFARLLQRGIRLTNASGLHAEPIAQYIFTYVLHWERQVARHLAQQRARHYEVIVSGDLTAKTLGIVGLGGIGLAAARVGKAFGMHVIGSRRSPASHEPDVDLWLPPARLHELLRASDYVVLCLPLTDATRHTIGAAELRAMRDDAVLINVARGGVIDEPALIEALRERQIRGASLDVTAEEPLPADSPLWSLENCVLTPHDAGYSPRANERLSELFFDNLARYIAGRPLRNEIQSVALERS